MIIFISPVSHSTGVTPHSATSKVTPHLASDDDSLTYPSSKEDALPSDSTT